MQANCTRPGVVSEVELQLELRRVFQLAHATGRLLPMISAGVDAAWHRLLSNTEKYRRFCVEAIGGPVRHIEGEFRLRHDQSKTAIPDEEGTFNWVPEYHRRFGRLGRAWFSDATGLVSEPLYSQYIESGCIDASWSCGVLTGGNGDNW